jgi:hypothetical protein
MLLEASQHGEIALTKHRAAVSLNIAGARALLLFGAAVLRHRGIWNEKRKTGGNRKIFVHRNLRQEVENGIVVDRASARLTPATNRQQRQWFLNPAYSARSTASGSDHHEIYTTFFKVFARQTVPRHLLDLVPVLPQMASSLLLGWKFGL